jgi:hypothetical protein
MCHVSWVNLFRFDMIEWSTTPRNTQKLWSSLKIHGQITISLYPVDKVNSARSMCPFANQAAKYDIRPNTTSGRVGEICLSLSLGPSSLHSSSVRSASSTTEPCRLKSGSAPLPASLIPCLHDHYRRSRGSVPGRPLIVDSDSDSNPAIPAPYPNQHQLLGDLLRAYGTDSVTEVYYATTPR